MHALFLGLAIAIGPGYPDAAWIAQHRPPGPLLSEISRYATLSEATPAQFMRLDRLQDMRQQASPTFRPRHVKSAKLRAAIAGAAIGFFGGAALGYAMTNRSGCDMCGLQGLVYGAPVGAVAGAIAGVHLKK